MTVLNDDLRRQLAGHLAALTHDVDLVADLDDSETGMRTAGLLDELAALSARLRVVRTETYVRRPSFRIERAGDPSVAVTFAGLPLGHEFTSLVLALLHVGGHPIRITDEVRARIEAIEGDHRFETFFSQSCQNCPDVVQALNVIAVVNPRVQHVAVDGAAFQEEAAARGVLTVPTVFRDGEVFGHGRMTLEEIVGRLEAAAGVAAGPREFDPFDVLVVGGGPAGVSAAVYAARKGVRVGIVAERIGGQVLDTMAIENLVAVDRTDGPRLAAELGERLRSHPVTVVAPATVVALRPAPTEGGHHEVALADGTVLASRTVILAPGARWRTLGVPGEDEYRNRGVTFCPHCDGPLFTGKRVAVIGGGNSGVEAALDLAGIVTHVDVVEFDDRLRADAVLQQALAARPNVAVHTSARTTEVLGDGRTVTGIAVEDRSTGQVRHIGLDGVFVQIGLVPGTGWLDGTVARNARGEIVVDERGATSVPGVFAAGDATTTPYKQIVVAMGDGATAAISAFDHLVRAAGLVAVG